MGCGPSFGTLATEPVQPNRLTHGVEAKRIVDDGDGYVKNFRNFQTARSDDNQKNCQKQVAELVMSGIEEEPDEYKHVLRQIETVERETQQLKKNSETQARQMKQQKDAIEKRERELAQTKRKQEAEIKEEEERIRKKKERMKKEEMSHKTKMKEDDDKAAKKEKELEGLRKDAEAKQLKRDWKHNMLHGTREEYLKSLTFTDDAPCPFHWSSPDIEYHPKLRGYKEFLESSYVKEELNDQDPLYHEVRDLFLNCWTEDGVVSEEGIQVFIIMNPTIQEGYNEHRAKLIKKQLSDQRFLTFDKAIEHCQGNTKPNLTSEAGPKLKQIWHPEINEFCLFHGTKEGVVETLCAQGTDPRVSEAGLHGTGTYFADSPTKSNYYTDCRVPGPNYMFVGRVLLGDMQVTQKTNKSRRRPPCSVCGTEKCTQHGNSLRNSVVYIPEKPEGGWLDYREFIVYEVNTASLDFLVVYNVMKSA